MLMWIKFGVVVLLSIFATGVTVATIEAVRQKKDSENYQKLSGGNIACLWVVLLLITLLGNSPSNLLLTIVLGVLLVLGVLWTQGTKKGGHGRRTACSVSFLALPITVGIGFNIAEALSSLGWEQGSKELLWAIGPVLFYFINSISGHSAVLYYREVAGEEPVKEAAKDWVPQLVITALCAIAIVGFSIFIAQNREVM
ncbi:hypothetical protein IJ103_00425 [Candidatus Saccharibacteria bacterium]|nr:hypothetical protein [Candidatus Saccharibacteria bacterium]